jgi:hypothetical protein
MTTTKRMATMTTDTPRWPRSRSVARWTAAPAVVVAGALLLSGCAPEPVDEAARDHWMTTHATAEDDADDVLGVLSAQVDAGDRSGDVDMDGDVSMTFAGPAQIRSVEFSCFGDGTVSGFVIMRSGSSSRSMGTAPMACADGVTRVRLPATWRSDVDGVSFAAGDSTRDSVWSVTIRGTGG